MCDDDFFLKFDASILFYFLIIYPSKILISQIEYG